MQQHSVAPPALARFFRRLAAAVVLAPLAVAGANAQSTDGYHIVQVIPVAVDSGSFAQRFSFTTPNAYPVPVEVRYFPGDGTAQALVGPLRCQDVVVPADDAITIPSLRALCPGLVSGNAFGFLSLRAGSSSDGMYSDIQLFTVHSRVSNPEGAGFSVEAFAAHGFGSGNAVVSGVRRLAATTDSPAFQTNCFVGSLNELTARPPFPIVSKEVTYTVHAKPNSYSGKVTLTPGRFVRLLDVFAAAGAPPGDYSDVNVVFRPTGGNAASYRPGILAFCTVQDNTSFGADFRIAKTSYGSQGIASDDGAMAREIARTRDVLDRAFQVDPGMSANTHSVYFRHPDVVQCRLLDPITQADLAVTSGLEMRLLDETGSVIGGGHNEVSTGEIFLGDKNDPIGRNGRYTVEVESNEQNVGTVRPYALYCSSGSGNTGGYELLRYKEAVDRF